MKNNMTERKRDFGKPILWRRELGSRNEFRRVFCGACELKENGLPRRGFTLKYYEKRTLRHPT